MPSNGFYVLSCDQFLKTDTSARIQNNFKYRACSESDLKKTTFVQYCVNNTHLSRAVNFQDNLG